MLYKQEISGVKSAGQFRVQISRSRRSGADGGIRQYAKQNYNQIGRVSDEKTLSDDSVILVSGFISYSISNQLTYFSLSLTLSLSLVAS